MKKKIFYITLVFVSLLAGCSRYGYIQKSFTTDEDIHSIKIRELDTAIIIEFTDSESDPFSVSYCESDINKEVTYAIDCSNGTLEIRKKDITKGIAFHLSSNDQVDEIPELNIKIPKPYLENVDILATDSSVKIIGGEINELDVKTTYYPIEIDHTKINNFTGITKYDSIYGTIIGKPVDFTVKANADGGNNNLTNHSGNGSKQIELETKEGDIDITFAEKK